MKTPNKMKDTTPTRHPRPDSFDKAMDSINNAVDKFRVETNPVVGQSFGPATTQESVTVTPGDDILSFTSPDSSDIKVCMYSPSTKEMAIQFQKGKLYTYQNVPMELWREFESAPSKGKYFHLHIRPHYVGTLQVNSL